MEDMEWREKKFSFFQHKECEYFPCHQVGDMKNFNCLFCFCPLYALGEQCGGNFQILENGIKDCSACTMPHQKENYGMVMERLQRLKREV